MFSSRRRASPSTTAAGRSLSLGSQRKSRSPDGDRSIIRSNAESSLRPRMPKPHFSRSMLSRSKNASIASAHNTANKRRGSTIVQDGSGVIASVPGGSPTTITSSTAFRTHASQLRRQRFCRHMFLVFKFIGSLLVRCLPGRLTIPEREWLFEHFTKAGELKEPAQVARLLSEMGVTAGTEEVGQVMRNVCFYKEGSLMDFRQFMLLAKFFKKRFEEFKRVPASLVAFVALGGNWEADDEGEFGNVQAEALEKTVEEFKLTTDVQKFIQTVDDSGDGELQYSEFRSFIDDGAAIRAELEEKKRREKEQAEKYDQYGRRRKRKKVYRTKQYKPPQPTEDDDTKDWNPLALLDDPEALLKVDDGTSDWISPASDDDDEDDKKSGDNTNNNNNAQQQQQQGSKDDTTNINSETMNDDILDKDGNNDDDNNNNNTHVKIMVDPDVLSNGDSVNDSDTHSHHPHHNVVASSNNNNNTNRRGGGGGMMSSSTRRARSGSRRGRSGHRHTNSASDYDSVDDINLNPQMMFSGVTEWISNHRDVDRRLEERDRTRKYREEIFSASVLHGRNYFADERAQTASMQHSNRFSLSDENFGSSNYVLGDNHSPGSDHHHYYHHADTARVTKYERPWDPHPPSTAPAQTSRHARHHPPVQTSRLTETAFGTAPRFKGDAPLVPLNEFNKQQRRQSSTSSAARRATSSSSKRRRQHFRDGPATVQSIQMHQSKIAGAAARGGAGGGGSNTNSAAGDSPIPSRPGTSSNQQNNNNAAKWYERDPFAPPSGGGSVGNQSSARRGRSSANNRLLPEIHRQKTGRTMIIQPDFVF